MITCIWMFLGVAFYSFVVGSLTSVMTQSTFQKETLEVKLIALEDFARETNLDNDLHQKIKKFLMINQRDLFSRVDMDAMI
mmetsp:Transcript_28324/g.42884  ORF Transcript_28324/g.42884 Transcript_28324/m.42884 type:complete len:81 (-) Transcript_28324:721-963(-)